MTIAQNFIREINSIDCADYKDVNLISMKFDNKRIIRDMIDKNGKTMDQDMIRFSDGSRCFVIFDTVTGEYVDKAHVTKKEWKEVFPDGEDSWEYKDTGEGYC